jgi:phage gpG-like protein
MITATIEGQERVSQNLRNLPQRASDLLFAELDSICKKMVSYIREEKLSGQVLKSITGELKDSIKYTVEKTGTGIEGTVGSDLVYAKVQEYGGLGAYDIYPANAQDLVFMMGGQEIFAKVIHHPALPERSFLRSSLKDLHDEIINDLQFCLDKGLKND